MDPRPFPVTFPDATREAGLKRLSEFLPSAGRDYADYRNHVPGVVSSLSPYVRHRIVNEGEIVSSVLKRHPYAAAEKFLQEVCWRTYWKGWLEMRPQVWFRYLEELQHLRRRMEEMPDLRERLQSAELGETGLECFDDWVRELRETGYLHNHVRMWFASIWIHTLRMPWQLGADFFMRHLLDGDPASNTLSWRWVGGLQTKGKIYLATAENIERFTNGRYAPYGLLAKEAPPIPEEAPISGPLPLTRCDTHVPGKKTVLLVTEEDLTPETWGIPCRDLAGIILLETSEAYPGIEALPAAFRREALEGTAIRLEAECQLPVVRLDGGKEAIAVRVRDLLQEWGASSLSIMNPTVGPTRSLIDPPLSNLAEEGVAIHRLRRPWDDSFWPHATHGFFKLKERIPSVLKILSV
jgi:deoxyribodipyrimidine photo-lyase